MNSSKEWYTVFLDELQEGDWICARFRSYSGGAWELKGNVVPKTDGFYVDLPDTWCEPLEDAISIKRLESIVLPLPTNPESLIVVDEINNVKVTETWALLGTDGLWKTADGTLHSSDITGWRPTIVTPRRQEAH